MRRCVCGAPIRASNSLCPSCLDEYGRDPGQWPEWVRYLVREERREVDRARLHREYALWVDTTPVDDRYPSEMGNGAIAAAWAAIREMRGE